MRVQIHGLGAVPGLGSGLAHVVDHEGDAVSAPARAILVARVFHPYFAPVLTRISGLVVEEGGLLQHAVVLAREFRVPAVVGVGGATASIASGDHVEIDGTSGTITITRRSWSEGDQK